MSDYRTAYHMAHHMFLDLKLADFSKVLEISPKDTMRLISVSLYLQERLKMY